MPKDEKVKELETATPSNKKIVVVEEVAPIPVAAEPQKEEVKVEDKISVPVISETTTNDLEKAIKEPVEDQEEKSNYLWIIIPTALLIGALVGGLITYFSGITKLNTDTATPTPVPTIEPTVTATPTASPSSTLKKDSLKVQILNGSGVSGAANKAKVLLEAAGYKNIDTGNATVSDLAQTEVAIKDIKKEFLDLLIKDLSKSYDATEAAKPLSSTSKFDIIVTIGKK